MTDEGPPHDDTSSLAADPATDPAVAPTPAARAAGHRPGVFGVVLLPGVALWRRWPVVASLLFAAGVIAPFYALLLLFLRRNSIVTLLVQPNVLRVLALVAVAGLASRFIAVWLTADRLHRSEAQRRMRLHGSVAVAVLVLPTALGLYRMKQADDVLNNVFSDDRTAAQVTVASPELDPYASEFRTVLLMGSDEGRDRLGLRTDSMIIAMVHVTSGRTALISVPRNLVHIQFPPGSVLDEAYPGGYDDDEGGLLNALYINVENDPDLVEALETDSAAAGMNALLQGLSYSMGITINDYLIINSCGFVEIVDAIGGVTITLDKELPMAAPMRCSNYHLPATIGPGPVYMDGTKALGYVRSRAADSDYQRMERQRILIQTIAQEIGFGDLLTNFGELADAIEDNVHTSMTRDEALDLLRVLQGHDTDLGSVGLVPPVFEPSEPDYAALKALMQDIRRALAEGSPVADVLPTESSTA